jgi:hypothetical protein
MATLTEPSVWPHTQQLWLKGWHPESYPSGGFLSKKSIFTHCTGTYLFTMKNAHTPKAHYAGGTVRWLLKWRQIHQEPVMACCEWLTTSRPSEIEVQMMPLVWHHRLHAQNAKP